MQPMGGPSAALGAVAAVAAGCLLRAREAWSLAGTRATRQADRLRLEMTYLSAGSCAGKDAVPKCRRWATTAAAAAAVRREAAACNPSVDASEASAAPRGFQTRSWPACPHPVTHPVRAAAGRTTATRCCCCACARPRRAAGACAPAAPALCPRRPTRARRCAAGRKVTSCGSAMPHTATSRRRRGPPSQSRSAPTARCSRPRSAPRTRARERPRGRMWHCCSTRIAGCDDAAAPRHLHSSASWWLPHSNS